MLDRQRAVHPRAGGEHRLSISGQIAIIGSSPRGRGTRALLVDEPVQPRFIPARAGNTPACASTTRCSPVHPRAGGEHELASYEQGRGIGSSPRGRGTPANKVHALQSHRFIPARAGNTVLCCEYPKGLLVHPRAGGEHLHDICADVQADGSSPRGRGTRNAQLAAGVRHRFIPARAGNTNPSCPARPCRSVHPRAGGEHTGIVTRLTTGSGSSPRGRGTPGRHPRGAPGTRFIPARAGNTQDRPASPPLSPVHPRAGGEHPLDRTPVRSFIGSSPRGRGTPGFLRGLGLGHRFIPARAGNTAAATAVANNKPVHPRAGGEHGVRVADRPQRRGSSPRGRGTQITTVSDFRAHRFIPARAGNTQCSNACSATAAVHPRAGGEHSVSWQMPCTTTGSSPRGRGTPERANPGATTRRFIPARAGNTAEDSVCARWPPVHPRAGGEHWGYSRLEVCNIGSSPRGRGTPRARPRWATARRFIPARAGNTNCRCRCARSRSVHPRAGGEHRCPARRAFSVFGSSPRGRGTPHDHMEVAPLPRFIPARAGNTFPYSASSSPGAVHPRAGGEHQP